MPRSFAALALATLLLASPAAGQTKPATQPDIESKLTSPADVLEIKYPPEGEWATAEEMSAAANAYAEANVYGKVPVDPDAVRRFIDFQGAVAQRFPEDEQAKFVLMNRWNFLGGIIDPSVADRDQAKREIRAFEEAGGKLIPFHRFILVEIEMDAILKTWYMARGEDETVAPDFTRLEALITEFKEKGDEEAAGQVMLSAEIQLILHRRLDEAEKWRHRLLLEFPDTDAAQRIRAERRPKQSVGSKPELTFTDLVTGEEIDLQDDLKGRVVLLDAWVLACGHCVTDLPELAKLQEKYGERGLTIIGINGDDAMEKGKVLRLMKDRNVTWPQAMPGRGEGDPFFGEWGIRAYPVHFIVDHTGTIRSVDTHKAEQSEPIIEKLVEEREAAVKKLFDDVAAAIPQVQFEIEFPLDQRWPTAEDMHSWLREQGVAADALPKGEERQRELRRVVDAMATFAKRYPEHRLALQELSIRWSVLSNELDESALVRKEMLDYLDRGGPLPGGRRGTLLSATVDVEWDQWQSQAEADRAEMPSFDKTRELIETYAADGDDEDAAVGLHAISNELRRNRLLEASSAIDEEIVRRFPKSWAGEYRIELTQLEVHLGKAFDVQFKDVNSGEKMSIADLKGKVVLIDFWATWCGPCVGDMDEIGELRKKYAGRGFEVVSISADVDMPEGQMKSFAAEHGMTWPICLPGDGIEGETIGRWGVPMLPTHFVLDHEGVIRSVDTIRAWESEAVIKRLLDERDSVE